MAEIRKEKGIGTLKGQFGAAFVGFGTSPRDFSIFHFLGFVGNGNGRNLVGIPFFLVLLGMSFNLVSAFFDNAPEGCCPVRPSSAASRTTTHTKGLEAHERE